MDSARTPELWEQTLIQQTGVKAHGTRPSMCHGTSSGPQTLSKVVKRSLQRAHRRIQQQGFAWYKGKCFTQRDFNELWPGLVPPLATPADVKPSAPQDAHRCNQTHGPRKRTTCLVWNCGGLAAPRLDEIRTWMYCNHITIGILLETRWQYTGEWSDAHWHYIHSGDPLVKGRSSRVFLVVSVET